MRLIGLLASGDLRYLIGTLGRGIGADAIFFLPQLEQRCPYVGQFPHLGGAALGMLVSVANTSSDMIDQLHKALDAERAREKLRHIDSCTRLGCS